MPTQKDISADDALTNSLINDKFTSYSRSEEQLNALSHGIGLFLSFVALFLLLGKSNSDISRIISFTVFAASGMLLFLASTIYHSLKDEKTKKVFKLDLLNNANTSRLNAILLSII